MIDTIKDWWSNTTHKWYYVIIVVWLLIPFVFQYNIFYNTQEQINSELKFRSISVADQIISEMNILMVTGSISDPSVRSALVKRQQAVSGIANVRITRADAVVGQFGDGLPSERPTDHVDTQVLRDGKVNFSAIGDIKGQFRASVPITTNMSRSGPACTTCHNVQADAVLGVVTVTLDTSREDARLSQVNLWLWVVDGFFLMFIIGALIWKHISAKVSYLAKFDSVTKLPNRNLLYDRLDYGLVVANRGNENIAVMFIDLDNFKHVNDSLGHHAGDVLLQQTAIKLSQCIRSCDTVARIGGDEFVIILQGMETEADVILVTEKIYEALAEPVHIETHELFVSASIGIAMYPTDGDDRTTLLKNADAAMYRAKRSGKGQYQFYSVEMNVKALELLTMESQLRHAIQRDEFMLMYQPQYNYCTGTIVGAEALIRWNHPEFGMVSPSEFIPIAEKTQLIVPIGEWVIRTACTQLAAWNAAGFNISISINVSAKQLEDSNFPNVINQIFEDTQVNTNNVVFELTESVLAQHPDVTHRVFGPLREKGVRLAIDDFGTGYSSLSYLKTLPLDSIKLDQTFVRDITNERDAAIVGAIVTLAHCLDLYVVAEGVETREQCEILRSFKCDEMQGYLFSKPVMSDKVTLLLTDKSS